MPFPGPPAESRLQRMLRPAAEAVVDLFYPRLCSFCRVPLPKEAPRSGVRAWFCRGCEEALPLLEPPYCRVCGEVYDGAFTKRVSLHELRRTPVGVRLCRAACRAEEAVRELVHQFKYDRRLQLRGALATLMLRVLDEPPAGAGKPRRLAAGASAAASQPGT